RHRAVDQPRPGPGRPHGAGSQHHRRQAGGQWPGGEYPGGLSPVPGAAMSAFYAWLRESLAALAGEGYLPSVLFYEFVTNALLCAIVIGPLLGAVGTMVVAKRMAFFSQAIGNAALTGVAIGVLIGESYTAPYVSLFSFCILF